MYLCVLEKMTTLRACSPLLYNIFMNDMKESVTVSFLRLMTLLNIWLLKTQLFFIYHFKSRHGSLSSWLDYNYIRANGEKTKATPLEKSTYHFDLQLMALVSNKAPGSLLGQ